MLLSASEAHLRGDSLDPYRMFTLWKHLISDAQEQGFSTLRGAGDMQWIVRGAAAQGWLAYERHLTELAADRQCLLLCQYGRPYFRAEQLLAVIRTHPRVIHRGTLTENVYYQPTEVVSQGRTPRAGTRRPRLSICTRVSISTMSCRWQRGRGHRPALYGSDRVRGFTHRANNR